MGVVTAVKALGTRQLAQPASGTDVEMGLDKYFCGQSVHVRDPGILIVLRREAPSCKGGFPADLDSRLFI
jgi:hypothetical protein